MSNRAIVIASIVLLAIGGSYYLNSAIRPRFYCQEQECDLGILRTEEAIIHTFNVENRGWLPLKIEAVRSSCKCTEVIVSGTGNELRVTAKVTMPASRSTVGSSISLATNDPLNPSVVLKLNAECMQDVELEPDSIRLGRLGLEDSEKAARYRLLLHPNVVATAKVRLLDEANPCPIRLYTQFDKPNEAQLEMRLAPDAPAGPITARVEVSLGSSSPRVVEFPINGEVVGNFKAVPCDMFFGLVVNVQTVDRTVELIDVGTSREGSSGSHYDIIDIGTDFGEGVGAKVYREGQRQLLKVTLNCSATHPERTEIHRGLVQLGCDRYEDQRLNVPFLFYTGRRHTALAGDQDL